MVDDFNRSASLLSDVLEHIGDLLDCTVIILFGVVHSNEGVEDYKVYLLSFGFSDDLLNVGVRDDITRLVVVCDDVRASVTAGKEEVFP